SAIFCVQTFPADIVEAFRISAEMLVREFSSFLNVFGREDLSRKVRLHDVLQAGNLRVIEKAAARADVGIDEASVGWVLPPMREFIAIGIEDRIEAKRLNRRLLKSIASNQRDC